MDKFEKKIAELLHTFSSAKEWSDLITIIRNLNKLLSKYENKPDFNLSTLKNKIALSKRLAQCLNPSLPSGLHEVTLDSYDMILTNILKNKIQNQSLGDDLPLYASGLFPFFQNASIQNKQKYLNQIILPKFLSLNPIELELILPGLLTSIIPALEEQNEILMKLLKEIFKSICCRINISTLYGNLWTIVIRNPRMRSSIIKYFIETIPNYATYVELNVEEKKIYKENYFPKMNTLIINSLCVVLEDPDVLTRRNGMDLIIKTFPLNCEFMLLSEGLKTTLLKSVLKLYIQNDYSITRRLTQWIFNCTDTSDIEIDVNLEETKCLLKTLITSLKELFFDSISSKETLISNIKIVNSLLTHHPNLSNHIMDKISFDIIMRIVLYWNANLNESENAGNDEVIMKVRTFFNSDDNYMKWLWESLENNLSTLYSVMNSKDKIKRLKFSGVVERIIKPLQFCLLYINVTDYNNKVRFYIPIISQLFQILKNLEIESKQSIQDISQIIFIVLVFVKKLQFDDVVTLNNVNNNTTQNDLPIDYNKVNKSMIENIKDVYKISSESSYKRISENEENKELLDNFTQNILLFQQYYISLLKQLFIITKQNDSLNINEINIFKQSTELIIRVQEYSQQKEIPSWLFWLEKISFCNNIKLSLEAIRHILFLMIADYNSDVYLNIKEHIYNNEIEKEIIPNQMYEELLKVTNNQSNYASILVAFLWNLLNVGNSQKNVVDLLVMYYDLNKQLVIDIISNTFVKNGNNVNITKSNINNVKRFTQFWKLTNEIYPNIDFFPNGECVFSMLEFLENEHPLIRHLSKSWLNQSTSQIDKIINPILTPLLSEDISWQITKDDNGNSKIYIDQPIDFTKIMEAFRKLKNIIINSTRSGIVQSLILHTCDQKIINIDKFGNLLDRTLFNSIPRKNYLELLINISLRFIKVHVTNDTNVTNDYFNINSTSCEFLEFLLGFIDDKRYLMKITTDITQSVIESLYEKLESNDEVMQLQLLNLLKVLIIDTKDEHDNSNYKTNFIKIIQNKTLLKCLIKGIQINNFFIRGYFISFIESILPIYIRYLEKDVLNETAQNLLKTTTTFLAERIKSIIVEENNDIFYNHNNSNTSIVFFNSYMGGLIEKMLYDEDDLNIIVKGMQSMIYYFLSIYNPMSHNNVNWNNVKQIIINDGNPKQNELNHCNSIIRTPPNINIFTNQLKDILSSFIIVWKNSLTNQYLSKDYGLSDKGIFSYELSTEKNELTLIHDNNQKENELKQIIINTSLNIFLSNPIDFMHHVLSMWMYSTENELITKDILQNLKLLLIDFLIELNIPLHIQISIITKLLDRNLREQTYVKNKSKQYIIPIVVRGFESKLCHFLYALIVYSNPLDNKTSFNEIWNELINLFNTFVSHTKITYSLCWLYELIKLALLKFPLNKVTGDSNIKKQLISLSENITKTLMHITFANKFDAVYDSSEKLPLPILPSLYRNIQKTIDNQDNKTQSEIDNFYHLYHEQILNNVSVSSEELMENERKIAFLTLKNNYYTIIYNLYKDKPNETVKMETSLLQKLISLIHPNHKTSNICFYDELAVEFIHSLMMDCPKITSQAGKQIIMEYFNSDSFFSTSQKIIHLWKDIICSLSMYHNDIITDLMNLMEKGFFIFKNNSNQIIKSLRRISFVIYSCNKDTFSNKLSIIKEKVKDLFISYANDPIIKCEIFLMIRVLFLRFSHDNIIDMIRALWPLIFSELIMIINQKEKKKHNQLITESFKFIELLSLANIEEFLLYQWIFIVDTFDVKKLNLKYEHNILDNILKSKYEDLFRPIVMNCCSLWGEVNIICGEKIYIDGKKKVKSELIITKKYSCEEMLEYQLKSFFYSIGDMNNYPLEVNYNQIEKVIEMDFIGG